MAGSDVKKVPSVTMFFLFVHVFFAMMLRIIISPFLSSSRRSPRYFKDVMLTTIRTLLHNSSILQDKVTDTESPDDLYREVCFKREYKERIDKFRTGGAEKKEEGDEQQEEEEEEEEPDCKAYWFGPRNAEKIIVLFPGGGYIYSPTKAVFEWAHDLLTFIAQQETRPSPKNSSSSSSSNRDNKKPRTVSLVLFSLSTTPESQYPTQLTQALILTTHLLKSRSPSSMLLVGDSSGGNLLLALLSRIAHPSPDDNHQLPASVPRLHISAPFCGVCLTSPWVSFSHRFPSQNASSAEASIVANVQRDMFSAPTLARWARAFLPGELESLETADGLLNKSTKKEAGSAAGVVTKRPRNAYTQPAHAGVDWWKPLFDAKQPVVRDVLVWAGGHEVMLDSIRELGSSLRDAALEAQAAAVEQRRVEVVVTPGASHSEYIFNRSIGYTDGFEGEEVINEWIALKILEETK